MSQLYKYYFENNAFSVTISVMATSKEEAAKYRDSALDAFKTVRPEYTFSPFAQPNPDVRRWAQNHIKQIPSNSYKESASDEYYYDINDVTIAYANHGFTHLSNTVTIPKKNLDSDLYRLLKPVTHEENLPTSPTSPTSTAQNRYSKWSSPVSDEIKEDESTLIYKLL